MARRNIRRIFPVNRLMRLCLVAAIMAMLPGLPPLAASAKTSPPLAATVFAPLSFTAGGHVLLFQSNSVYVASGSHVLTVEFQGTHDRRQAPVGERGPSTGSGAPPLGKVTYSGLWPGVDLTYESLAGGIAKSTYYVAPGGNVDGIRLSYNVPVVLGEDGSLVFGYETGEMRESAPVAWQDIEGERAPVAAVFTMLGEREVGLAVGSYDANRALVIDPSLAWNTILGGTGTDAGYAIAVDGSGNTYITGYSDATWGSPVLTYTSGADTFVAKLDSNGALQWNTFLGGSDSNIGYGLTVGGGYVYVASQSHATWGSPVRAFSSGYDADVAKLDSSSGALQWHTFLGGSGDDPGIGIAVDGSGNTYVTGYSTASWGSPVRSHTSVEDGFAAKLNSSGVLQWNTFLGGSGSDLGRAIAVDGSGNSFVAGYSNATWGTSPVRAYSSGNDAFVVKLDGSGAFQWHTFLGGSGDDYDYCGIALDGSGNIYLAGASSATWGSPMRAYSSGNDIFAAKLNGSGVLQWNTFLGGSGVEYGSGVAVDASGNTYVAGYGSATWGSPIRSYTSSSYDAFAAKLDSSGVLLWNTFLGGSGADYGIDIALDESGTAYVAGYGYATWGSPIRDYTSGGDVFVARLSPADAYADRAGVCGSNAPCFSTLSLAFGAADPGRVAYVYSGAYTESLSISSNVTATLSATVSITGSVSLTTGTLNTNGYTLTVSGDWSNTGGTYTDYSGGVIFDKAGTATLSKTGTGSFETFCNVTVSSTTTLDVTDDYIEIRPACTLTINGAMRREAPAQTASTNTPLTYLDPLSYTTVAMTSTGGTALGSTAITTTIGQSPPSCNGNALNGSAVKRWYQIAPATSVGVSSTLRLYYAPDYAPGEANGLSAGSVNLLHCGTSGGWTQISGTATRATDEDGTYYVEVPNVSIFSSFALGTVDPTAVGILSFNARSLSTGVEVGWETASELYMTGFDVWRAEGSGDKWERLNGTRIVAEGAASGNRYTYMDDTALPGHRYLYRLEVSSLLGGSEWYGPVSGSRGWAIFLPMIVR